MCTEQSFTQISISQKYLTAHYHTLIKNKRLKLPGKACLIEMHFATSQIATWEREIAEAGNNKNTICMCTFYMCVHTSIFNWFVEKSTFLSQTYSALSCWNSLLQKVPLSVAAVGHYFKAWCYLFSLWWIPMILGKYKNMIVISSIHHQSICYETFQHHLR